MRLKEDVCMLITLTCLFVFTTTLFVTANDNFLNSRKITLNTTAKSGMNLKKHRKNFYVLLNFNDGNFDFSRIKSVDSFVKDLCYFDNRSSYYSFYIEELDLTKKVMKVWIYLPVLKAGAKQEICMLWGQETSNITDRKQIEDVRRKKEGKKSTVFSKEKNPIFNKKIKKYGSWDGNGINCFKLIINK